MNEMKRHELTNGSYRLKITSSDGLINWTYRLEITNQLYLKGELTNLIGLTIDILGRDEDKCPLTSLFRDDKFHGLIIDFIVYI